LYFVMVGCIGQPLKRLAGSLAGTSNPIQSASQRFEAMGGGLLPLPRITAMTTLTSKSSAVSNPATTIKIPHFVADERGKYRARTALTEAQIIKAAQVLLSNHICRREPLTSPNQTRAWLQMQYMDLEHEVFACLFLDSQHCVIAHEVLFRGTIDGASVYPREVVKRALQVNAAALMFIHNHPSGALYPSKADRIITDSLKQALSLIDVRTLDHFIVSKMGVYSFAEHGFI